MAPTKKPKTYSNTSCLSNVSKSVAAVNALFALNLSKRIGSRKNKARVKLKPLPPKLKDYSTDDSLMVNGRNAETTFDRILRSGICNPVETKEVFNKLTSSESELSKSAVVRQLSFEPKPLTVAKTIVKKRVKRKNVATAAAATAAADVPTYVVKAPATTDDSSLKPRGTWSRKCKVPSRPEKSNPTLIDSSLSIEKAAPAKNFGYSSFSYLNLQKIVKGIVNNGNGSLTVDLSKNNQSLLGLPVFSDTFRENHMVHSSTPSIPPSVQQQQRRKIVVDPISPIQKPHEGALLAKSYEEIQNWDRKIPVLLDAQGGCVASSNIDVPNGSIRSKGKRGRKQRSSVEQRQSTNGARHELMQPQDWKLRCSPRVVIQPDDVAAFKGFAQAELDVCQERLRKTLDTFGRVQRNNSTTKNIEDRTDTEATRTVKEKDTNRRGSVHTTPALPDTRQSYITLRRRKLYNKQESVVKRKYSRRNSKQEGLQYKEQDSMTLASEASKDSNTNLTSSTSKLELIAGDLVDHRTNDTSSFASETSEPALRLLGNLNKRGAPKKSDKHNGHVAPRRAYSKRTYPVRTRYNLRARGGDPVEIEKQPPSTESHQTLSDQSELTRNDVTTDQKVTRNSAWVPSRTSTPSPLISLDLSLNVSEECSDGTEGGVGDSNAGGDGSTPEPTAPSMDRDSRTPGVGAPLCKVTVEPVIGVDLHTLSCLENDNNPLSRLTVSQSDFERFFSDCSLNVNGISNVSLPKPVVTVSLSQFERFQSENNEKTAEQIGHSCLHDSGAFDNPVSADHSRKSDSCNSSVTSVQSSVRNGNTPEGTGECDRESENNDNSEVLHPQRSPNESAEETSTPCPSYSILTETSDSRSALDACVPSPQSPPNETNIDEVAATPNRSGKVNILSEHTLPASARSSWSSSEATPKKDAALRVEDGTPRPSSVTLDHSYSSPFADANPGSKNSSISVSSESSSSSCCDEDCATSVHSVSSDCDIIESSQTSNVVALCDLGGHRNLRKLQQITLKPGKMYRRSLAMLRRSTVVIEAANGNTCSEDCICIKCTFKRKLKSSLRLSSKIVSTASRRGSLLEKYAEHNNSYAPPSPQPPQDTVDSPQPPTPQLQLPPYQHRQKVDLEDSIRGLSLKDVSVSKGSRLEANAPPSLLSTLPSSPTAASESNLRHHQDSVVADADDGVVVSARDVVLRKCGQTDPLPFEECYPPSLLLNCRKIGEGVYGEVFLFRNERGTVSVMKVIPIEGDQTVNGERQKRFEEILSEIVIALELSHLRRCDENRTGCFSEVYNVRCVEGRYPERLLDLWELYDETQMSENDSPRMFPANQLYIVLELANGGQDMEAFAFKNAAQACAMFKQVAWSLAVAESQLKFEHRDLHWGNVLIRPVENKMLNFCLKKKEAQIATQGIEVCIIDFTLSRIECDGVVIYNDLSQDNDLFTAKGDYQFEIYRLMQNSNGNEWQHFQPYTNVLWLHYILDKAITAFRYKVPKSKFHRDHLRKLKTLRDEILRYSSVADIVNSDILSYI